MMNELKQKLRDELVMTQPQIRDDRLYNRCVNKYVDGMLLAINDSLANYIKDESITDDQFAFSQFNAARDIGRIGKPQQYIYYLLQKHPSTSLLLEVTKGFSKKGVSKLSVMKFNSIYEDLIIEELLNLKLEKNQQLLDEIERTANYAVDVDTQSLRGFISKTQETIRTTTNGRTYKAKLLRNLAAAQQLLAMVHEADASNPSSAYLRERWVGKDSGRIYGQGYSLQRMPKEVRHAALGVCHKYDFKTCSFALMAGLAHAIDPMLRLGATLDYVKNRSVIRQRIANEVNISVGLVKTIFTALGFGAELKNTPYNSIRNALGMAARKQHDKSEWLEKEDWNKLGNDEYARLTANQTFMFIYDELHQINSTIINFYKVNPIEIGDLIYSDMDPNYDATKNNKRKINKRTNQQQLAWIFQALESTAMKQFAELAQQEPLLTTHDCIYFKQKLPASLVTDITYELQQTFKYLTFEHEKIYPIANNEQFDSRFMESNEEERRHKDVIRLQELKAENYESPNNFVQRTTKSVLTDSEYEKQRRAQFMRDVGIEEYSVD